MQNSSHQTSWVIALSVTVYSLMLTLYPARFRREFADEMRDVFTLSMKDAARHGGFSVLIVFMGEVIDLPLNLLREYLYAIAHNPLAALDITLYRARWITRLTSAGIAGFLTLMTFYSPVQTQENLLSFVLHGILFVSTLIAWRWEISGGIVLITSTVTIGIILVHAMMISTNLFIISIVASTIWAAPHVIAGMMFISLGRRAHRLKSNPLTEG